MKIAQRLHYNTWWDEKLFNETLAFLQKHKAAVDEIALFSSHTTSGQSGDDGLTMQQLQEEVPVLRERMQAFRDGGFSSVGVNVLFTLGHIDEAREMEHPLPFQKIVGYQGDVSNICNCPSDEAFLQFTEEKYRQYASTKPDFIWVDDDIKVFWNGVKFGCFCPECLRHFNEENGFDYTREALVAAMEVPENSQLRGLWVRDISDRITRLLKRIGDAVRSVDPTIRLGFMTQRQSWSTYNGMDFPAWFTALGAEMGRPGEGCYYDALPKDLLTKTYSTAQQAFEYPETVTDIQYELENFPIHTWQKSAKTAIAELSLAAAAGINGVLLNNSNEFVGLRGQDKLYEAIAGERVCWKDWLYAGENQKNSGFYPAFSLKYDQRRTMDPGESYFTTLNEDEKHDVTRSYAIAQMGVPITMQQSGAWGVILTGNLSQGYTDEELLEMFRGPVIVAGNAVEALERRGFGKYLGVSLAGKGSLGLYEEIEPSDPVNRELLECPLRNVHPCFFGDGGHWFTATAEGVRTVSYMKEQWVGTRGIATSLYENELGGRVCVLGYAPFHMQDDLSRFLQLSAIQSWLLEKRQKAKILTPGRTVLFVREGEKCTEAAVMNLTMDEQEVSEIAVLGAKQGWLCTPEGKKPLSFRQEGDWAVFDVGPVQPFTMAYLITE